MLVISLLLFNPTLGIYQDLVRVDSETARIYEEPESKKCRSV